MDSCTRCTIRSKCKGPVGGYGDPAAPLVLLGEGPGFMEDCTGIPLVGYTELVDSKCAVCKHAAQCFKWFLTGQKSDLGHVLCPGFELGDSGLDFTEEHHLNTAGQILNDALDSLGLTRQDVYTLNTIACRAHDSGVNRPPTDGELLNCMPHMVDQFKQLKPKAIVLLGWTAVRVMIPMAKKLSDCKGVVQTKLAINFGPGVHAYPANHPSYLLRTRNEPDLYKGLNDEFRSIITAAATHAFT